MKFTSENCSLQSFRPNKMGNVQIENVQYKLLTFEQFPHHCSSNNSGNDSLLTQLAYHKALKINKVTTHISTSQSVLKIYRQVNNKCLLHLEIDGDGVWPGQFAVLLPPPLDHQGHIEAKQEGNRDPCALSPAPPRN